MNRRVAARAVATLLEDPDVPKVLQNGLYDRFALGYGHAIRIRNCAEDTMRTLITAPIIEMICFPFRFNISNSLL